MENRTYELITAISMEGISENWSTCKNVNTRVHFGTKEDVYLEGFHIYIYLPENQEYQFVKAINPDKVFNIENDKLLIYKVE